MTERQKKFIDYYIQTGNASESARRAGYSADTAEVLGCRLLRNVKVRRAMDERLEELKSARTVDTQAVLEHLSAVLRGEVTETLMTIKGTKVEVPVRECDRLAAAEKLLRVFGAYKDKVEVTSANLYVQTLTKIAENPR